MMLSVPSPAQIFIKQAAGDGGLSESQEKMR
jgi:hypothetical protein